MGWKDRARDRAAERKEGRSLKLSEGENYIRILPNKKGTEHAPYYEFRTHREVGPDKTFVRCGRNIDGTGKCWLCDVKIPQLLKSDNKAKRKMGEALEAREQFLVQACKVSEKSGKFGKPKPWWVSTGGSNSLATRVLSLLASTKRSYDDPTKGYNITIERTGTGMRDTRYPSITPDEEPTKVPKQVLTLLKKFEELVPAYSAEEQEAAFLGKERPKVGKKKKHDEDEEPEEVEEDEEEEEEYEEEEESEDDDEDSEDEDDEESEDDEDEEEEEDDEEDEDEKPKSKKSKSKSKSKSKKKSKDEEEEEEENEDDEEEEESEDDDEDSEEDEEEEDDDEDEKPAKKSKSKKSAKPAKINTASKTKKPAKKRRK